MRYSVGMVEPAEIPTTLEETREALRDLSQSRFGKVPHDRIVEHIIAATPDADWPVRRAALDALLRRWKFADRDELVVTDRPSRAAPLGSYRTGRSGAASRGRLARPYATRLDSIEPLAGVCDCPDFLHGSLGVCKHLLCVLADVFSSSARVRAALAARRPEGRDGDRLHVTWDPIRPLRGSGDRLEGLRIHGARELPKSIAPHFARPDRSHARRIKVSVLGNLAQRTALICELERATDLRIGRATPHADPCVTALLRDERARAERRLEDDGLQGPSSGLTGAP